MGICSSFSKTVLVIINIIFWICAAFLVYCAVEYLNMKGGIASIPTEQPAKLLLGAASVFFLCGIIGFAAAIWEHKCVLGMFLVIVFITMVMLFGGLIVMAIGYKDSVTHIDSYFLDEFNKYDRDIPKLQRMQRDISEGATAAEMKNTTPEPKSTTDVTTTAMIPALKTTMTIRPTTTSASKPTTATTTTPGRKTTAAMTTAATNTTATTPASNTTTEATTTATTPASNATTTAASTTTATTPASNATTTAASTTTATTPAEPTTPEPKVNTTKVIDDIQTAFECCGWAHNYTDWNNFTLWKEHTDMVPGSCCNKTAAKHYNKTCPDIADVITLKDLQLIYEDGCRSKLHTSYKAGYRLLQWTTLTLGILTFLGLAAILYLAFKKRRDPTELGYSSIVA